MVIGKLYSYIKGVWSDCRELQDNNVKADNLYVKGLRLPDSRGK